MSNPAIAGGFSQNGESFDGPPSNAIFAGAGTDVSVETLAGFDHVNSWIQAMPRAVPWFRSFE